MGRLWLRCRVCETKLATWYALISLAALSLLFLLLFYGVVERHQP